MTLRQIAENTFTLPVFYLLYEYPTITCEPLSRELRHSPDVNECVLSMFDLFVTGCLITRLNSYGHEVEGTHLSG